MRRRSLLGSVVLAGCSLTTSFSDLSGGPLPNTASDGGADSGPAVVTAQDAGDAASAGTPDGGSGVDASIDFFDDFNRPPSTILGNGWLDKTAGTFSLDGQQVVKTAPNAYPIVVAHRPPSEDLLNVEVSADITISCASGCFPGLVTRIVSNVVDTADHFLAYDFFVGGSNDTSRLGNPHLAPGDFSGLQDTPIDPPLVVGQVYRFTFRVTGTSPVTLEGTIVKDGVTYAHNLYVDTRPEAIAVAGSVGITGNSETGSTYDNFRRHPL
jgi:hypothetical protein